MTTLERTVQAIVVAHGMHKGKPCTDLEIPSFKAKYPTRLYGVDETLVNELLVGKTYTVVLRGDLKDGEDGQQPWHYFWNFLRVANALEAEHHAKAPVSQSQAIPDKERDIRRAVALKAAVEYSTLKAAVEYSNSTGLQPSHVIETAETFEAWLAR